jgi:hypothetical protein
VTPEQERLAAAFLAECWAPVREYRQTKDERAAATIRTELLTVSTTGELGGGKSAA